MLFSPCVLFFYFVGFFYCFISACTNCFRPMARGTLEYYHCFTVCASRKRPENKHDQLAKIPTSKLRPKREPTLCARFKRKTVTVVDAWLEATLLVKSQNVFIPTHQMWHPLSDCLTWGDLQKVKSRTLLNLTSFKEKRIFTLKPNFWICTELPNPT